MKNKYLSIPIIEGKIRTNVKLTSNYTMANPPPAPTINNNVKDEARFLEKIIGILSVSNNIIPQVITDIGIFNLNSSKLTKHTDGNWIFNMSLGGNYTSFKEGDKISGILSNNNEFIAFSLVP